MANGQKILTFSLWGLLIFTIVGVCAAKFLIPGPVVDRLFKRDMPAGESALPVYYPAADFKLTDQDNKPTSTKDLGGRPWIAAFVFTRCGGVCPAMTNKMVGLQKLLPAPVQLVSFSVDPEYDTPAVLKQYAAAFKADESRWRFLTGTKQQLFDVAAGMKIAAQPAAGDNPIIHSEKLTLVDADGNIRGYYESNEPEALKRLVADAAELARAGKDVRAGVGP